MRYTENSISCPAQVTLYCGVRIYENRGRPATFNEALTHRVVRISVPRFRSWHHFIHSRTDMESKESLISEYPETETEVSTMRACLCRTQQISLDIGWQVCICDVQVPKLSPNTRLSKTASFSQEGYRNSSAKWSMVNGQWSVPSLSPHLTTLSYSIENSLCIWHCIIKSSRMV
jgi:hypothetical protein